MLSPTPESRAHSFSPAGSINTHGKRARSPDDDIMDEITATFVKAQKVTEGPKASDYDEVAKQVILTATGVYRCLISTMNAFPTPGPSEEASMIREAWDRANVETAQEVPITLSPIIAKVVSFSTMININFLSLIWFRSRPAAAEFEAKSKLVL